MATGNFTFFRGAKARLISGEDQLGVDEFAIALTTNTQTLNYSFLGTQYDDLTAEVANGNGYTTGGKPTTLSVVESATYANVYASNVYWSNSTVTAKYAVIYNTTTGNLLGFIDLDTSNVDGRVSENGTIAVVINSNGLFRI